MELVKANNIVEAACKGASDAIPVVANIAVMLVAFVSLIECMNDTLKWLGQSVGHGMKSRNTVRLFLNPNILIIKRSIEVM